MSQTRQSSGDSTVTVREQHLFGDIRSCGGSMPAVISAAVMIELGRAELTIAPAAGTPGFAHALKPAAPAAALPFILPGPQAGGLLSTPEAPGSLKCLGVAALPAMEGVAGRNRGVAAPAPRDREWGRRCRMPGNEASRSRRPPRSGARRS
jgi:hypothetical protein